MSWAEVKKINSNMNVPLDESIGLKTDTPNANGSLHAKVGMFASMLTDLLYGFGWDTSESPGPKMPIVGNRALGYYGFVAAAEMIDGAALASAIGLSAGTAQYSDAGWLKWIEDGVIKFTALKPLRYNLSWNHINAVGAVFGTKTVTINGKTYKVRLMTGGDADPATVAGGEWNKIMYGVHKDQEPAWGQYTDADLVTGKGSHSWCQETMANNSADRVLRGAPGVTDFNGDAASGTSAIFGWRPVLELL